VACGVGAILVATLGALAFSAVSLYLYTGPFGSRLRFDGVLRFRVDVARELEPRLGDLLGRHCRRQALLSVSEIPGGEEREHVYQVKFFRDEDGMALLQALRKDIDARDTRLLLQEASAEY
jgi:hypothetical protein